VLSATTNYSWRVRESDNFPHPLSPHTHIHKNKSGRSFNYENNTNFEVDRYISGVSIRVFQNHFLILDKL